MSLSLENEKETHGSQWSPEKQIKFSYLREKITFLT